MDDNNREYTNGEITVFWRPKECIHATTCFRELRAVFDPGKRPWVNMDGAPTSEIVRICDLCPTNALTYKFNEVKESVKKVDKSIGSTDPEKDKPAVEVRVMRDGPLVVRGDFTIKGSDGEELNKMKIASFCRCGHSAKMPFCDGAHRRHGWISE